jgi:O-methyltransferase domain
LESHQVVAAPPIGTASELANTAVGDRCTVEAGSVFERVPEDGDVYLLAKVLHDWDDAAALEILQRVRASASADSRLLVLESVVTADAESRAAKLIDLVMLALVNGQERTATEWIQLLASGGWRVTSLQDGLIEAQPA